MMQMGPRDGACGAWGLEGGPGLPLRRRRAAPDRCVAALLPLFALIAGRLFRAPQILCAFSGVFFSLSYLALKKIKWQNR